MTAAVALPLWLAITRLPADQALFIYSAVMALFIVYWHRSNIRRMRRGEEHRNTRLMVFRRKEPVSNNEQH
jgi:glycerol-3-phosphate acyltransferase PlsY